MASLENCWNELKSIDDQFDPNSIAQLPENWQSIDWKYCCEIPFIDFADEWIESVDGDWLIFDFVCDDKRLNNLPKIR